MDEFDELTNLLPSKPNNKFIRPFTVRIDYDFYIVGVLSAPENYIEEFDLIRNAQEDDVITLHINTTGGDLSTAIQFMRVIKESRATIVASVEGYCMSAGTLIFLASDEFIVSDHSIIQCHNYSGGTIGSGHEMFSQVSFERPWSIKLFKDIYDQFLTQSEIEDMVRGVDVWLSSDETIERCKKLQAYRLELYRLEQEEE